MKRTANWEESSLTGTEGGYSDNAMLGYALCKPEGFLSPGKSVKWERHCAKRGRADHASSAECTLEGKKKAHFLRIEVDIKEQRTIMVMTVCKRDRQQALCPRLARLPEEQLAAPGSSRGHAPH